MPQQASTPTRLDAGGGRRGVSAAHMCCRTKPNCSPLSECRGGGLWLRALAQGSGTALTFGGATMPRPQDIALGGGLCGPLEGALAMGHGPWPWAPRFRPGNACCCSWWVAAEFWWAPLSPGIGWRSPATHSQHARPQNAAHSLLLHFVGGGQWSSTALWCFCFTSNFQTLTRSASARPKSTLVRVSCAYCPAATQKGCHVRYIYTCTDSQNCAEIVTFGTRCSWSITS